MGYTGVIFNCDTPFLWLQISYLKRNQQFRSEVKQKSAFKIQNCIQNLGEVIFSFCRIFFI